MPFAFAALVSACGGSTAPTTGPSAFLALNPAPTPAPPLTPATPVSYPNVIAAWTGTLTIDVVYSGGQGRGTTTCDETWIVRSQSAGSFAGTFQSTGDGPCMQSGTLSGSVTLTGAISDLTFSTSIGDNPLCTRSSGGGRYSGTMSATGITVQAGDQMQCSLPQLTATAERTLSIAMTRR